MHLAPCPQSEDEEGDAEGGESGGERRLQRRPRRLYDALPLTEHLQRDHRFG
ncbi:MAG: hypothetical protein KDD73_03560 [Anaerolineales bacterium]|nr:hypothetical protein [Anaerolineales bacterium]MCB9172460.1 hypothetical protein [Ardenticatenales bacterium]